MHPHLKQLVMQKKAALRAEIFTKLAALKSSEKSELPPGATSRMLALSGGIGGGALGGVAGGGLGALIQLLRGKDVGKGALYGGLAGLGIGAAGGAGLGSGLGISLDLLAEQEKARKAEQDARWF